MDGFRALQLDRVGDVLRVAIAHPASELNTVDGLLHGRPVAPALREFAAPRNIVRR